MSMKIIKATSKEIEMLTPLFDKYRVFYEQESDVKAAQKFLIDRFENNDSIIFMAISQQGSGIGFTQLYPSFSSVSMKRLYILNDLFVVKNERGQGIAESLLEHAKNYAQNQHSVGLALETARNNPARNLYERLGWKNNTDVIHYSLKL